jgi:hypothetical protein
MMGDCGSMWRLFCATLLVLSASENMLASTFGPSVSQGTVTAPAIVEASGLVASLSNANVLWTENDSGNPNTIFAIDTSGRLLGTYYLDGAVNTDWEDIAIGPGPEPGVSYVYVADSNTGASSKVFRIPEPTVYAAQQTLSPVTQHLSGAQAQVFFWPAPNSEAMFVDRQNGDIYLGSKETGVTKFYRATQSQFGAPGTQNATFVASVPLNKGNGADLSPSGNEIFVRNQDQTALLYHRATGQTVAQALASPTPDAVTINGTNVEPNAESITFDSNGINFFTFSEGLNQKLYKYTRTSNDGPTPRSSLLAAGSAWKYLDGGATPGVSWNQSGFNDASWVTGGGPFGYGQAAQQTLLSYGADASHKPASFEFRTTFNLGSPSLLSDLSLTLLADDGAAVYINGTEVTRFNLAAGAGLTDYASAAVSDAFQNTWRSFTISPSLLHPNSNTLAVEVHGSSPTDNDLRFDLSLSAVPLAPLAGDVDLDRQVTVSDIQGMMIALADLPKYESDNGLSGDQASAILNLDHDSAATNKDLQTLINAMANGTVSAAAVPEPTSVELAVISCLVIARLRPGGGLTAAVGAKPKRSQFARSSLRYFTPFSHSILALRPSASIGTIPPLFSPVGAQALVCSPRVLAASP